MSKSSYEKHYLDAQNIQLMLKLGMDFRKKYSSEDRWDLIDSYYEQRFDDPTVPTLNLVYMFGRALLPTLVYEAPQIVVTPRRPEFFPWASLFDSIDNLLIQELEVEELVRSAALHSYLYNTCGMQIGFDKVSGEAGVRNRYLGYVEVPGECNRVRRQNWPWLDIIDPRRLIFAPGTKNDRTCQWYAKIMYMPTWKLMEMPGIIQANVKGTHIPTADLGKNKKTSVISEEEQALGEFTVFYEVHHVATRMQFLFSSEGKFLTKPEDDYLQVDGLPMKTLSFNPSTRSIWGTSDALYIEGQMLEANDTLRYGMMQRKESLLKALVDEEMITEEEMEKFYQRKAMPMIRVKRQGDRPLTDGIALLQPRVQSDYYTYVDQAMKAAQLLLGFGPNQFGVPAGGRKTKYETQVVEQRNMIRVTERRGLVGKMIVDSFRMINQLLVQNWDQPIVQRVVGADGAMYWVEAMPLELQDLKSELSLSVDIESMAPPSKEKEKEEMLQMMQMLGRTQGVNVLPIMRKLISKFKWADVNEILPQAPQDGNIGMEQFIGQQQKMLQQPNLGGQAKANLERLSYA